MKNKENKHLEGVLKQYIANKHDDIDGLVITKDGKEETLKFPPHTAKYVMDKIGENRSVEVWFTDEGHRPDDHKPRPPKKQLEKITDQASGVAVIIADYFAPKPADSAEQFEFFIEQPQIQRGKKDEIISVTADGKLFHLKPKEAEQIKSDSPYALKIKAKKRLEDAAFVNRSGLQVYHVTELTAIDESVTA